MTEPAPPESRPAPASPSAPGVPGGSIERLAESVERISRSWEKSQASERRWRWMRRLGMTLIVGISTMMYLGWYMTVLGLRLPSMDPRTQIAMVTVEGTIGRRSRSNADTLTHLIGQACRSTLTQALVIRVRSPGGDPSESARIGARLEVCRERNKPVVAYIDGIGASGGYLIAASADDIVADRYAYVGSIGAVAAHYDAHELVGRWGLQERVFTSGPLKHVGSLATPINGDGEAYIQSLVEGIGARFLADIQARRGDRLTVPAANLYTGEVWLAEQALAMGLIDEVDTMESMIEARWPGVPIKTYASRESLLGRRSILHDIGSQIAAGAVAGITEAEPVQADAGRSSLR